MTKPKPRPTSCEGCGGELPDSARRRRYCSKECGDRAYRVENAARRAEQTAAWNAANPERRRAIRKKHADANRDELNAKAREKGASGGYSADYAADIARNGREVVLGRIRTSALRRRYGLTEDEYDALLAAQGGTCAICPKTPEDNGRRLAVDHDHSCCPSQKKSCGKCIRALLCTSCNNRLGIVEDVEWMTKARMYLDSHAPQEVA